MTRSRRRALVVSVVVLAAVVAPGLASLTGITTADGFPLSTYPMFARDRGRVVDVASVIGRDARGEVHRLSPETIAGTDQVIQAGVAVRRAIDRGPAATTSLCEEVAGRLSKAGAAVDDGASRLVRVEVVEERYDAVDWAGGARDPLARRVIGDCAVP